MTYKPPYKEICSANVEPEVPALWKPLIDGKYVHIVLQESQNMLPGFAVYWRISIYQNEAQGVEKRFLSLKSAQEAYNLLVKDKIPGPHTLTNYDGFQWNF